MTAINAFRTPGAVHLLTDGCGYHPDGTVRSVLSKVQLLPHLSAALAGRGNLSIGPTLALALNHTASTFDGLCEALPGALREAIDTCASLPRTAARRAGPGSEYDLVTVGWSETQGPMAFLLTNHESYGLPAWELIPCAPFLITPADPAFMDHVARLDFFHPDRPGFDPARDGARLVREQRARKWNTMAGGSVAAIGGFSQLTTITADAITTRVLERWPDRVGRKIAA